MSFQKCPVCDGEGRINHSLFVDEDKSDGVLTCKNVSEPCTTCQGRKIIHSVTGLPPQEQKQTPTETPAQQDLKPEDIVKPLSALDEYSEDEILYWSTPYFDELQAKKALRAQQIKDKEDIQ